MSPRFETVAFCEIEEFPQQVLRKHWPKVPIYEDVRTLTRDVLDRDGISVDVITGGFPCQDISAVGRQAGLGTETRSGLWSEIVRLIGELRPRYVIVENVANLLRGPFERPGAWFGRVLGDLAECGYDAEWQNIPEAAVGAPHLRERVWIVAYPNSIGLEADSSKNALRHKTFEEGNRRRFIKMGSKSGWSSPRPLGVRPMVLDDGLPKGLDDIKAFGNSVVPRIPELIGNCILEAIAQS
jgi:DNA (cytosine-5)-methyltransferase 1